MNATSLRPHAPAAQSLSARRRLLDEAAAQLVAAWDTDLDARAPADDASPKAAPSANARQAQRAVVSAVPPPSPSASIPTHGVEVPTDVADLTRHAPARRRWPWMVAAAAVLTPLLLWGVSGGSEEPAAVTAAATEPQAATAVGAENAATVDVSSDSLPKAPAAPQHTLVVRTIPPGAVLHIDGVAVDNPYSAPHAADTTLHLVATAADHKSAERDLELDEDVNLMITLSPNSTAKRPPPAARPKARPKRAKSSARKQRPQRRKPRAEKSRVRRRTPKKSSTGFVSNNPYR